MQANLARSFTADQVRIILEVNDARAIAHELVILRPDDVKWAMDIKQVPSSPLIKLWKVTVQSRKSKADQDISEDLIDENEEDLMDGDEIQVQKTASDERIRISFGLGKQEEVEVDLRQTSESMK